jgi:hypothetical protein
LFDPRGDVWDRHFKLDAAQIVGLTPVGRATVALLRFNDPDRVEFRASLMRSGRYP